MTPLEALHSATVTPAEFFGLENEMGQIKAGAVARRRAAECQPACEDITATRSVEAVINRGVLLTREQLSQLVTVN